MRTQYTNPTNVTGARTSLWFTFFGVVSLAAMFVLSRWAPDVYSEITQEDHLIELGTVVLFVTAAVVGLLNAWMRRSMPEALIGGFCFFAAGEELNWGQRHFGFMPPEYFLQHNLQQEFSLHNLAGPSLNHFLLAIALMVPFLLVPLLATNEKSGKLLEWVRIDVPSKLLLIWSLIVFAIYTQEPVHLASEWGELLIAGLFCARAIESTPLQTPTLANTVLTVFLVLVCGLIGLSAIRSHTNSAKFTCAHAEVESLLQGLNNGAATQKLFHIEGSAHRRLFLAGASDFVKLDQLNFKPLDFEAEERRKYLVDPWGMSYWLYVRQNDDGSKTLAVYSFGPNRRRDLNESKPEEDDSSTDDIVASIILPAQ